MGNESFRLIDKLVDSLFEIKIVVSGSPKEKSRNSQKIEMEAEPADCGWQ